MSHLRLIICIAVFAAACFSSTVPALGSGNPQPTRGRDLPGKFTPKQIKSSCGKAGGEFFPQGKTGTFGCENHKTGKMVLCNKHGKCTIF
jgi:hypothetical protein